MINYYKINESSEMEPKILGKGLKKCIFIMKEGDYNNNEEKLEEILKAVKLDKQKDVLIYLTDSLDYDQFYRIALEYGVQSVISFGMKVGAFFPNMQIANYVTYSMESFSWLNAPDLHTILSSRDEKMKLWKALQSTFLN